MRAILHIGIEKTGTTSIQKYLYKNRPRLGRAGYHFLQSGGEYENRALPAICIDDRKHDDYLRSIGVNTTEERQAYREVVIQDITRELSELPANIHTVLISSEHFHSRIRTEEEMDNVYRLLSRFFDEFKIICYLREQVSTCSSWYSTSLKANGTQSFADFMERCNPGNHYFNYYEMLASWECRFGLEAMDVALFSRSRFLNGDLLDDFTQRVDPKLVGSLNKRFKVENESMTPMGQALARAINLTFPEDAATSAVPLTRDKYKKIIKERFKGAGQFPAPETCRELYETFIASNEQLRQKYFPEVETLFQPPAAASQQGEVPEDSLIINNLYFILDLMKRDLGEAMQARDILSFCGMAARCINDLYTDGEGPSAKALAGKIFNDQVVRMLRDTANLLERVDMAKAVSIMELAKAINPSSPQVEERLKEYRELLTEEARQRFMFSIGSGHPPEDPGKRNALTKKMSDWRKQLSVAPQMPMPVSSRSLLVGPDGSVTEEDGVSVALYLIIEADSMSEALAAAKMCPVLEVGGSVRVSRLASRSVK